METDAYAAVEYDRVRVQHACLKLMGWSCKDDHPLRPWTRPDGSTWYSHSILPDPTECLDDAPPLLTVYELNLCPPIYSGTDENKTNRWRVFAGAPELASENGIKYLAEHEEPGMAICLAALVAAGEDLLGYVLTPPQPASEQGRAAGSKDSQ